MNEHLTTPQHKSNIGYLVLMKGISLKRMMEKNILKCLKVIKQSVTSSQQTSIITFILDKIN